MIFHKTTLQDAYLLEVEKRGDDRGFFTRTFCAEEFREQGIEISFVQQNSSFSAEKGTLRGMHKQNAPHAEDKLVRCIKGSIVDIIVDLRPESSTFKKWEAFELSETNRKELLVPRGFGHGFQTLEDNVEVTYLVSNYYTPEAESGVRHDDPAFGIEWPLPITVMSDKDRNWPLFEG